MAKLVVIPTPIGNLDDISQRAIRALDRVESLICEDTRVTGKLLQAYRERGWLKNKPHLITYNDFNARKKLEEIKQIIKSETEVGLVSDAGMPVISDPGYRLIRFCYDEGIEVEVLPGASAVTMAMVMSALGGEEFLFLGFLPKKKGKEEKVLEKIKQTKELFEKLQVIVFVSPHRLSKDLELMERVLGEKTKVVLLRELTKKFEERIETTVEELKMMSLKRKFKGEMVLVFSL